ncbi:exodeoxyribonuclease III [Nitrincola tapanii]|uniref:Exodeoxyribonuclease III n=1 Tax=Nitrincola tapanii TaxID=1708751 RepID=A0A5A9W8J7_9GAMM|nr:exodeoxyribonuclease III [Nitrincola tapanii]KAA0875801.1 exodeoxyribonuclease III [Nitrincola tapanii]
MKLVSFNTNSIRMRLHQLQALIDTHQPDLIGIQETKVTDAEFPVAEIEALGYHAYFFGQKTHYGVCILSKTPALSIEKGFPGEDESAQRRLILGEFVSPKGQTYTLINGYFPQGESIDHAIKFPAKRKFYADLQNLLETRYQPDQPLAVMGDFNISPEDTDIGIGEANRKRWLKTGKTSFQPEEREWMERLKAWGLQDTYRVIHPERNDRFSWFDYRSKGFEDEPKRGLRIDTILATACLSQCCTASDIDYAVRGMEKPSDHAPVWSSFDF